MFEGRFMRRHSSALAFKKANGTFGSYTTYLRVLLHTFRAQILEWHAIVTVCRVLATAQKMPETVVNPILFNLLLFSLRFLRGGKQSAHSTDSMQLKTPMCIYPKYFRCC